MYLLSRFPGISPTHGTQPQLAGEENSRSQTGLGGLPTFDL